MFTVSLIATLALPLLKLATAQVIAADPNVPEGYQVGFATVSPPPILSSPRLCFPRHPTDFLPQQDNEPTGQQSICNTNCQLANPFSTTAGPTPLAPGVYAAAAPPSIGGGPTDCAPCGTCYSIIQSGTPYCQPDPYDPNCGYVL